MAEETQPPAGQEGQSAGKPAPHRIDPYKNFKFMAAEPAREGAVNISAEGETDTPKGK